VFGLKVLYQARPIQAIPSNSDALTIPAIIACLCCVTFVDGFPLAALPYLLSRHDFISAEGRLSEAFGCCSV
jgi:hypothetical protein